MIRMKNNVLEEKKWDEEKKEPNIQIRLHNKMHMEIEAVSQNEGLARIAVAAFMTNMNPTVEEVCDVKTAVSEAVTNAIIHGYRNQGGKIGITCIMEQNVLQVIIIDRGVGISNIKQAMEPMFTTGTELERSGMGFSFMEAFMDELKVESIVGMGTKVLMKKKIGRVETAQVNQEEW